MGSGGGNFEEALELIFKLFTAGERPVLSGS